MLQLASQFEEAVACIRRQWSDRPRAGIILGSGLRSLADQLNAETVIPFSEIPHFPAPTAIGHGGRLICWTIGHIPIVVMDGRAHCYEGHSAATVAFPVRVMKALGIEML